MITIEALLVAAGTLILCYGLYLAQKLRTTLGSGRLKEAWDVLSILIAVFIVGYLVFLVNSVMYPLPVSPELVTGVVFFLGSIFVAVTAYYNYRVFRDV